ncbi:SRPBCC family protein [Niabella aurantiaca]|uniref:SRPBCC family protein n=1 Tax=Niabella aurantiaca TaxID=379900 RepID=UPI00037A9B27|nr:SRPBCC domain-containing protein [Niabella aurantiaca]
MERKTKIQAEDGRQDLVITREFDLPLDLLFRAYTEPGIIEQWMGTKVLKLENRPHGGYQFETSDGKGNVAFRANGAIHEFVPEKKITRTFEMENAPLGIQLEFLEFEPLSEDTSKLIMQIVYRSAKHREEQLKLPFSYGINMAHDRLEEVAGKLK